jgi:hypothetical protein
MFCLEVANLGVAPARCTYGQEYGAGRGRG